VSPILSNLFLHELDCFVEEMIKEYERKNADKKPYLPNRQYQSISMRILRLKKKINKLNINDDSRSDLIKNYIKLNKERRLMKSTRFNPEVIRIKYIRYADD
jgi:predicted PolB exonuclease-like 3'-5' exonuclease